MARTVLINVIMRDRVSKSMRGMANSTRLTRASFRDLSKASSILNNSLEAVEKGIANPTLRLAKLGLAAHAASGAFSVLGAASVALVGNLGSAASSSAALLGIAGALGQGFLVTAFATQNMGKALAGQKKAYDKLTPAGKQFVDGLKSMHGEIQKLRQVTQENLFKGLITQIKQTANVYMPLLRTAFGQTASVLNHFATVFLKLLRTREWRSDFKTITTANVHILGYLGNAFIDVLGTVKDLWVALLPLTTRFAKWIATAAHSVAVMVNQKRASGALEAFFKRAGDRMAQWGRIIGNVSVALFNIFKIGTKYGGNFANSLEKITKKFENWTKSASGKNAIEQWFKKSQAAGQAFMKVLKDLGKGVAAAFKGWNMAAMFQQIDKEWVPSINKLMKAFGHSDVIKNLITAIGNWLKIMTLVAKSGVLSAVGAGLELLSKWFLWMVQNVPGLSKILGILFAVVLLNKAAEVTGLAASFKALAGAIKFVADAVMSDTAATIGNNLARTTMGTRIGLMLLSIKDGIVWIKTETLAIIKNSAAWVANKASQIGSKVWTTIQYVTQWLIYQTKTIATNTAAWVLNKAKQAGAIAAEWIRTVTGYIVEQTVILYKNSAAWAVSKSKMAGSVTLSWINFATAWIRAQSVELYKNAAAWVKDKLAAAARGMIEKLIWIRTATIWLAQQTVQLVRNGAAWVANKAKQAGSAAIGWIKTATVWIGAQTAALARNSAAWTLNKARQAGATALGWIRVATGWIITQTAALFRNAAAWLAAKVQMLAARAIGLVTWIAQTVAALVLQAAALAWTVALWIAQKAAMVASIVVMGAIRAATVAWTAAQWLLNIALDANPIGLLALAIVALIAIIAGLVYGIIQAYKHCTLFRQIVQGAFNAVRVAALLMWQGIKIAFDFIAAGAVKAAKAVKNAWNNGGIVGVFKLIGNGIKSVWQLTWNAVRATFNSAWSAIRTTFNTMHSTLSPVWTTICNGLKNGWNAAWNFIRSVFNSAWAHIRSTFNTLHASLSSVWTLICNGLKNGWNAAWNFIRNVFNSAWSHIRSTFNTLHSSLSSIWTLICNGLKNGWNAAWNFVRSVFNSAWSHIRSTFNTLHSTLSKTWTLICNGLKNGWNAAWNAVRNIFNSAWSHIRGTFSTLHNTLSKTWTAICNGLKNGWNAAWTSVRRIFNVAWGAIRGTFNTMHSWLGRTWTLICHGLGNGWNAAWTSIRRIFNVAWGAIRGTFNTMHSWLSRAWSLICHGLGNGWNAAWTSIRNIFNVAWSHIRGTFNTLHGWVSSVWGSICHGLGNGWNAAWTSIRKIFNAAWGALRGSIHVMARTMGSMWQNIISGTARIWNGLKAAVGKPVNAVIGFIQKLAGLADKALSLVHITTHFASSLNGFKIGGFANGGIVPGGYATGGILPGYSPGHDNITAMSPAGPVGLSGGEGILRPEVMRAPGMANFLHSANYAARTGGVRGVTGMLVDSAKVKPGPISGPSNGADTFKAFGVKPEFQNPNGGSGMGFALGGILPSPGDIVKGVKGAANVAAHVIPGVGSAMSLLGKGAKVFEDQAFDMIVGKVLGKDFDALTAGLVKGAPSLMTFIGNLGKTVFQDIVQYVTDKTTPKTADGDPIYKNPSKRLTHALDWARSQQGKPYQWGGGGNPSWDCSGFMAGIQCVIDGKPPGRLYTTMDFRGKSAPRGWVKDLASPFMVGVTNAGVGHMAGTLINHHVESNGSGGVGVDHGHRGAFDKLFKDHYGYKPVVHDATLVSGGGKGGPMSGTIGNGSSTAFVGTFWDTGHSGHGDTGAPASGKPMHKFAMASRGTIPYGKTAIMQAYGQKRMAAFESIDYGPGITSRLFDIDTYGAAWLFGKEGQWSSADPGRDVSPGVFRVHWKKGFAKGGNMLPNQAALVGENGPEVLVPNQGTTAYKNGTAVTVGDTHIHFHDKVYCKSETDFEKMVVTAISEAKRKKKM